MSNNVSSSSSSSSTGIGFIGLLTIAFIVLKLTDVIQWSWIWVLSPIWISAILYSVVVAVMVLAVLFVRWKVRL